MANGNTTLNADTTFALIRILTDRIAELEEANKSLSAAIQK